MKISLLLLFFFLPIVLFATTMDVSKIYSQALTNYEEKKFQQSYKLFHSIYLDKLSDINFNFRFGRSAYETGHYEMALAAFERVEIQDPKNLRNILEMARTYYMLRMYEDAQSTFRTVLDNPNIPKNIRTNIELSLAKVSKVQEKSFTYSRAIMNILFDSNLNYGSLGDYQYGGGTFNKIDEISDIALEFYANVTNIYDIGSKNGFAIKNSFSAYDKEYYTEEDYNTMYLSYSPSLLYKETKFMSSLSFTSDVLFLNQEKFLATVSIMPFLQYNHTPTISTITYFKVQEKKFLKDSLSELDATRYEFSYGLQSILSPRSYLQGNLLAIGENKLGGSNLYVDFEEFKVNTTYSKQIYSRLGIKLFAQSRLRNYKEYSSGFKSIRRDLAGAVNANISIKIFSTLEANIKTSYEYVDSNQDRFSYQKYTVSAGIIKTF